MITSNESKRELHHSPLGTKDVIAFLVLSRPILFRQPSKNEEDGLLHPTLDCVNVFPFQMINSEAPPCSTFRIGEKNEEVLFRVKIFAINM
jgi:hypothetical protein